MLLNGTLGVLPDSIVKEIETHKQTLTNILSSKFADQSYILGLDRNVDAKFYHWILDDLNKYYDQIEGNQYEYIPRNQQELIKFNTILYFDKIWNDFHYPIIKFYQYQHASLFNEILQDFNQYISNNDKKNHKFKVKPVEMRKIYDSLNKFLKEVHNFYTNLLKKFTQFENPLISNQFLSNFDIPQNEIRKTSNLDLQENLSILIHRCLLNLGNLSRHRSFIEMSYVTPCLSNSNFWKFRNLNSDSKSSLVKPLFEKALKYYHACIHILPSFNEPYNHIGMIYNLIDDKYQAVYWFLRSNFTGSNEFKVATNNLLAILKKKTWLTDQLLKFYNDSSKSKKNIKRLNYLFICLICYYFLPDLYHNGPNIVKNFKYIKVENDFFNQNFVASIMPVNDIDFHLQQLIILSCFQKLIDNNSDEDVKFKFNKFVFRYIDNLLNFLTNIPLKKFKSKILILSRYILNWIKENKLMLRILQFKHSTLEGLANLFNSLLDSIDVSQPIRYYLFDEDVLVKGLSIIKFNFKDFKDQHLADTKDSNILNGDYS
ncbi:hypothetical protein HYPBUDRAFT_107682, partial [Hyphopichia burtonii NRRL Y-1933]